MLAIGGFAHEIIDLERWGEGGAPAELLAVNPLGQVPTLVLPDGGVMTESSAIILYLADLAPEAKLAPPMAHPLRGRYLRWMAYLAANSYMTALRFYYPERFTSDSSGGEAVKLAAVERAALEWCVFSDALAKGPFILGREMCAADLYAAMLLSWDLDMDALFKRHPNLQNLYEMAALHPGVAPVWQRHGV